MSDSFRFKVIGMLALAFIALLIGGPAWSAPLTPVQILKKSLSLYDKIEDYQVTVKTQVRMEGLDIPDRTGTLYYKKPDKLKIDSDQIMILPRQAVLFMHELGDHLEKDAKVLLIGEKRTPQKTTYVLKIIPKKDNPARPVRVLTYVDGRRWTVDCMKIYEGAKLILQVDAKYTHVKDTYWLPSSLKLTVTTAIGARQGSANEGGTASITFSNYRVNLGLGDAFFEES